jgi:2-keto-3-deoxy-L-rhamnonate aldolase RhmA
MNDTSPYTRNNFKHKVLAGERCSLISFRLARTVDAAMIAKTAGHDAFYVDAQHCPIDGDATAQILGAALEMGITPMVRIRGHNQLEIARALDCGALGWAGARSPASPSIPAMQPCPWPIWSPRPITRPC